MYYALYAMLYASIYVAVLFAILFGTALWQKIGCKNKNSSSSRHAYRQASSEFLKRPVALRALYSCYKQDVFTSSYGQLIFSFCGFALMVSMALSFSLLF